MLRLVLGSTLVIAALAEGSALADDGHARFRGGVGAMGGVLYSDAGFAGTVGPYVHVGVQLDDAVGLFGVFEFDGAFAENGGGVRVRHALGIDWTLADRVSLGVGPSLGALIGAGGVEVETGALFHLAAYPWMKRDRASHGRKGLALSIDLTPAAMLSRGEFATLQASFGAHAALGIGYEVF